MNDEKKTKHKDHKLCKNLRFITLWIIFAEKKRNWLMPFNPDEIFWMMNYSKMPFCFLAHKVKRKTRKQRQKFINWDVCIEAKSETKWFWIDLHCRFYSLFESVWDGTFMFEGATLVGISIWSPLNSWGLICIAVIT